MSLEIPNWLTRYEPQISVESLVEEVNKIFHSFDAAGYDSEHPEIHRQLPAKWAEMIAQLPDAGPWNVLDAGCGTGFEAGLVLSTLRERAAKLAVYDPSPEMIAICKTRLDKFPQVSFCSGIEDAHGHGPFNLLLTNSLLHHLPDIGETMKSLLPCLTTNAVWLAGHEPSARFYRNDECLKLLEKYRCYHKYAKWFELGNYKAKLRLLLGRHPLSATAGVAYKRGLFLKRPSPAAIDRIVDFHVAHSAEEVLHGRGLDIETMEAEFHSDWDLRWSNTYSFLGPFAYAGMPNRWVHRARQLERRFPSDGANFCTVWHRKPSSMNPPSTEWKASF